MVPSVSMVLTEGTISGSIDNGRPEFVAGLDCEWCTLLTTVSISGSDSSSSSGPGPGTGSSPETD